MRSLLLAAGLTLSTALEAQQLRGVISDSATKRPVPGAIVMLLDSTGRSLVRTLADEAGEYVLPWRDEARRVRTQRMGFRPRDVALPSRASQMRVDVALLPVAAYLEAVSVSASACSSRRDRKNAITLFDMAKEGLLATVVAREANPARMVLYGYERTMDGMSERIVRQTVSVDSAVRAKVSYSAPITGKEMVETGFVRETQWGRMFLAPDADVLLGTEFATGYCFTLAKPDSARPNQLGIAFEAARAVRDRVDIEGALWVDTLRRSLVDLEFNYVGLPRREVLLRPGGRVEFHDMPNGAVLVDRWKLRLIGYEADSVLQRRASDKGPASYQVLAKTYVTESGGELAEARWRDARSWHASLGAVRITARTGGKPAVGAILALDEAPYRGAVDSSGLLELHDLVPGPYRLTVIDPALADVDQVIPTTLALTAVRDSTISASVDVPSAADFIYARCLADKQANSRDSTRVLFRAMTHSGDPLGDVSWTLRRRIGASDAGTTPSLMKAEGHLPQSVPKSGPGVSSGAYTTLRQGGVTGTDGMFQVCTGDLKRGTRLLVQASRRGYDDAELEFVMTGALQVVRLNLTPSR